MGDISFNWDNTTQSADWCFTNGDLQTGNDLETAVILSLFSDRRANSDYVPNDGTNDRRGWWGDTYQPYLIGSRLWQLSRSKISNQSTLLLQVRDICQESLQWLLDAGAVQAVKVATFWLGSVAIGIKIIIQEPAQSAAQTFNFQFVWSGPAGSPPAPAGLGSLDYFVLDRTLLA